MSSSNYLKNIAIVGSTGNSGSFMTKSLLESGKHTVTAITRLGSKSEPPKGAQVKSVDYNDRASLVVALKGQDALVITMSATAPPETQHKLIEAAGDAGVSFIMPNDWAPDTTNEGVQADVGLFAALEHVHHAITKLGKSDYIGVTCGFWYEWSVSIPPSYGFDFAHKTATFFDDGETKICTSTWPQLGRAVAAILSLPIKSESGLSLDKLRNRQVFINSFTVSQRDMFESVLRVTGDKAEDWKIIKQPARKRYADAMTLMKTGDRTGFIKAMYTRIFYDDGNGDYSKIHGLSNEELGLPKESLDEATKVAIQRAKDSPLGQ